MRLRTALNEYKRANSAGEPYPGENVAVSGAYSGHGDRLVHVDSDGAVSDYSAPLSGLFGVDRSRFGIETADGTYWFGALDTTRQHYYRETNLVETEHDAGDFTVHQYDLTLGRAHMTHVELRGAIPEDPRLVAFLTLAPEGQETRVGNLVHDGAGPDGANTVEVFHRREHDYVTASTGVATVRGQIPERFPELTSDSPLDYPRETALNRYEDTHLSGDLVVTAPLEAAGRGARTSLVTQLSDHTDLDRESALADIRHCAEAHRNADEIRATAREHAEVGSLESVPRSSTVRTDLRVFDLLTAPTGGRIAAPECDPFFVNSGGYGYVWFRDDVRVARHLLDAEARLERSLGADAAESVRLYCETQLDDGTWPHRVWAADATVAPGWANARLEGDDSDEYQADQTASVTTFLARVLRERSVDLGPGDEGRAREAVAAAVEAMVDHLHENGLPDRCQSAWEDATGQFAHTAGAYLEAFAAVGRAPLSESVVESALEGAETVLEGLGELWDPERGIYAMCLEDGERESRLDSATFSLVDALCEYDAVEGTSLPAETLDRIRSHVGETLDGLHRNPADSPVAGLARYEGDRWRRAGQDGEKVWSLATALGALGATRLGILFDRHGRDGEAFLHRGANLYQLLTPDGPLTTEVGYLAAQVFDDGKLDGATPQARTHAMRLATMVRLAEQDALPAAGTPPEGPTERPRWTTGEKYGLGTVADHGDSDPTKVWYTLASGALTEARYPRVDLMNLRTLDFLITAREGDYTVRTHNETRRDDATDTVERRVEPTADDALLFEHVITETSDGHGHEWTLRVEYAADPDHDAILADVQFEAEDGKEYDVFAVADVALTNTGTRDRGIRLGEGENYHLVARDPSAYTGEDQSPLLTDGESEGYSVALAFTTTDRFDWATVGAAGSERMADLFSTGRLPETETSVDNDTVVLVGRLGSEERIDETVALGFARQADTAGALGEAEGALATGYGTVRTAYADSWRDFLADRPLPDAVADDPLLAAQYRTSLMSLLAVEDKTFYGASIASPSVPWGEAVTAAEPKGYGYNFVWSRDLYQVFTVFDIVENLDTAIDQLEYIYEYQQDGRGFIPQNTYVNGITRWGGEQMDNISFPQVMAYHLYRRDVGFDDAGYDYENVRRSANYVARNGPSTVQERWEEEGGYSPSSIAAEIAGLSCAGKLAIETGHDADALVWLALADHWANKVEDWTATETGTDRHTETPYYVRVTRDGDPDAGHRRTLANNGPTLDERDIIDAGFLELARLGIKPADDEVIRNSIHEVDDTVRVGVDGGAAFYRYNGDGYGERESGDKGAPWSVENFGKGRLWPLLTGERAEYELLLDPDDREFDPRTLLESMASFANSGRMIAEQVWDREYGTDYNWTLGEGTGSATPLAWSMAQYVRLAHALDAGRPVETPEFVRERYLERQVHARDRGPALRVETRFVGNRIVVSGETTGELVAARTDSDAALVEPADGEFEIELDSDPDDAPVIVATASGTDLERAGTTVNRLWL